MRYRDLTTRDYNVYDSGRRMLQRYFIEMRSTSRITTSPLHLVEVRAGRLGLRNNGGLPRKFLSVLY